MISINNVYFQSIAPGVYIPQNAGFGDTPKRLKMTPGRKLRGITTASASYLETRDVVVVNKTQKSDLSINLQISSGSGYTAADVYNSLNQLIVSLGQEGLNQLLAGGYPIGVELTSAG